MYPGLLACLHRTVEGKSRFTVLVTNGEFLLGNADTEYKRMLFELLTGRAETAIRVGELESVTEPQSITFTILMEHSLEEELAKGPESAKSDALNATSYIQAA